MSSRDLDKIKLELNGDGGGDHEGEERLFSKRAKKVDSSSIMGVAIPINLEHPTKGKLRCYLSLSPDIAQDEETLFKVVDRLEKLGYPVDFYRSKGDSGGFK